MTVEQIAKVIDVPVHIVERHLVALAEKGLVKRIDYTKEQKDD